MAGSNDNETVVGLGIDLFATRDSVDRLIDNVEKSFESGTYKLAPKVDPKTLKDLRDQITKELRKASELYPKLGSGPTGKGTFPLAGKGVTADVKNLSVTLNKLNNYLGAVDSELAKFASSLNETSGKVRSYIKPQSRTDEQASLVNKRKADLETKRQGWSQNASIAKSMGIGGYISRTGKYSAESLKTIESLFEKELETVSTTGRSAGLGFKDQVQIAYDRIYGKLNRQFGKKGKLFGEMEAAQRILNQQTLSKASAAGVTKDTDILSIKEGLQRRFKEKAASLPNEYWMRSKPADVANQVKKDIAEEDRLIKAAEKRLDDSDKAKAARREKTKKQAKADADEYKRLTSNAITMQYGDKPTEENKALVRKEMLEKFRSGLKEGLTRSSAIEQAGKFTLTKRRSSEGTQNVPEPQRAINHIANFATKVTKTGEAREELMKRLTEEAKAIEQSAKDAGMPATAYEAAKAAVARETQRILDAKKKTEQAEARNKNLIKQSSRIAAISGSGQDKNEINKIKSQILAAAGVLQKEKGIEDLDTAIQIAANALKKNATDTAASMRKANKANQDSANQYLTAAKRSGLSDSNVGSRRGDYERRTKELEGIGFTGKSARSQALKDVFPPGAVEKQTQAMNPLLSSVNKLASGHKSIFKSMTDSLVTAAKWYTIYAGMNAIVNRIQMGFRAMVSEGVEFYKQQEQQTLGLRGIIDANYDIVDAQEKMVEGASRYNAINVSAKSVWKELQSIGFAVVGTTADLLEIYNAILPRVAKYGGDLKKAEEITKGAVLAANAMGMSYSTARTSIVSILNGNVRMSNAFTAALGYTEKQVKDLIKSGKLLDDLQARFSFFAKLQGESEQLLGAKLETFRELVGMAGSEMFKPFIEGTKAAITYFQKLVGTVKDNKFEMNPAFEGMLLSVKSSLRELIPEIAASGKGFVEMAMDFIPKLTRSFVDMIKVVRPVVELLAKLAATLANLSLSNAKAIGLFAGLAMAGSTFVSRFKSSMDETVKSGEKGITVITTMGTAFKGMLTSLAISTLWAGVLIAVGAVIGKITDLIDKAKEAKKFADETNSANVDEKSASVGTLKGMYERGHGEDALASLSLAGGTSYLTGLLEKERTEIATANIMLAGINDEKDKLLTKFKELQTKKVDAGLNKNEQKEYDNLVTLIENLNKRIEYQKSRIEAANITFEDAAGLMKAMQKNQKELEALPDAVSIIGIPDPKKLEVEKTSSAISAISDQIAKKKSEEFKRQLEQQSGISPKVVKEPDYKQMLEDKKNEYAKLESEHQKQMALYDMDLQNYKTYLEDKKISHEQYFRDAGKIYDKELEQLLKFRNASDTFLAELAKNGPDEASRDWAQKNRSNLPSTEQISKQVYSKREALGRENIKSERQLREETMNLVFEKETKIGEYKLQMLELQKDMGLKSADDILAQQQKNDKARLRQQIVQQSYQTGMLPLDGDERKNAEERLAQLKMQESMMNSMHQQQLANLRRETAIAKEQLAIQLQVLDIQAKQAELDYLRENGYVSALEALRQQAIINADSLILKQREIDLQRQLWQQQDKTSAVGLNTAMQIESRIRELSQDYNVLIHKQEQYNSKLYKAKTAVEDLASGFSGIGGASNLFGGLGGILGAIQKISGLYANAKKNNTLDILTGMGGSTGPMALNGGGIGGSLKNLFSPKSLNASGGAQGIMGVAGNVMGMAGMAGQIASSAMAIFGIFKGIFSRAAKKIAENIKNEINEITEAYSDGSASLITTMKALEDKRTDAIRRLSGKKGGQSELDSIIKEIDNQLDSLKDQQKQIFDNFNDQLTVLRAPKELQSTVSSIMQLNKTIKEYVDAGGSAASATEYWKLSLKDIKDEIQKNITDAEKDAIDRAIELNDLYEQRADIIENYNDSELEALTKGSVERQLPNILKAGKELQELRENRDKELESVNRQIKVLEARTSAEKEIFGYSQSIAALKAESIKLEIAANDKIIAQLKEQVTLWSTGIENYASQYLANTNAFLTAPSTSGVASTVNNVTNTYEVNVSVTGATIGNATSIGNQIGDSLTGYLRSQQLKGLA